MPTYRMNVQVRYPGSGSPGLNTWHFRSDSLGIGDDQPHLLIQDFYSLIASEFQTSQEWAFSGELIEDPYGSPTYTNVDAWTIPGTGTGVSLGSRADQCVITWRTPSATRAGRGRTFLGPIPRQAITESDGQLTDDFWGAITAAANDLVSANGNIANGAVGVFSRSDNVLRDITGSKVGRLPAVLRSRRD